jgi:hypothetical protein
MNTTKIIDRELVKTNWSMSLEASLRLSTVAAARLAVTISSHTH